MRYLREQAVDWVNSGKWGGRFSDVRRRLQTAATMLRGVDSALPAVRRLECAAELMEGAPDIARQKLDVQERPGTSVRVVVGSTSVFEVQNLGAGNRVVAPEQFPPCLKPGVVGAATEGPGRAAVPDQDLPRVEFECLGLGDVKLTTTTEVLVVV